MKELTKQQKDFLRNYAHSLNAAKSALDAGYSESIAGVQAKNLLSRAKYQTALNSIIEREVDKLEIPKAYILKKYLQIIDYASGECGAGLEFRGCDDERARNGPVRNFEEPRDAGLLLKALEGLQRFLERGKDEPKNENLGGFWQIDNVDCTKI